jgi:hypothetical protein
MLLEPVRGILFSGGVIMDNRGIVSYDADGNHNAFYYVIRLNLKPHADIDNAKKIAGAFKKDSSVRLILPGHGAAINNR